MVAILHEHYIFINSVTLRLQNSVMSGMHLTSHLSPLQYLANTCEFLLHTVGGFCVNFTSTKAKQTFAKLQLPIASHTTVQFYPLDLARGDTLNV